MIEVIINDPEKFEMYLKKFQKMVDRAGFLQELKDRRYYQKPSEKRHLKAKMIKKYGNSYKNKKGA